MTFAHGEPVHIVLPSQAPICPKSAVAGLRGRVSPADQATHARVFTGNSPTSVPTAADCDDPRPESRTTIA